MIKHFPFLPDGNAGHGLKALLWGGQGGGASPEVDEVLLLQPAHALNHRPQPPLEGHQPEQKQRTHYEECGRCSFEQCCESNQLCLGPYLASHVHSDPKPNTIQIRVEPNRMNMFESGSGSGLNHSNFLQIKVLAFSKFFFLGLVFSLHLI